MKVLRTYIPHVMPDYIIDGVVVCKMNVHHRCHGLVPRTCGQDLTEPYGRIQLAISCMPLDEDSQRVNIQS